MHEAITSNRRRSSRNRYVHSENVGINMQSAYIHTVRADA